MPAAAIPVQRTKTLWGQGWTHQRIVELYNAEGIPCTASGLSKLKGRLGLMSDDDKRRLPFRVKAEHANNYWAHVVRYWMRMERGESVSEREAMKVKYMLAKLAESKGCIAYYPEVGWQPVERMEADTDEYFPLFNHNISFAERTAE